MSWESLNGQLPHIEKDRLVYSSLGLKADDIALLLQVFQKIDRDNNGTISVFELLEFFETTESEFVKKAVRTSIHSCKYM